MSASLPDQNDTLSETDTVGQIIHYIMKKEGVCPANAVHSLSGLLQLFVRQSVRGR